MRDLVTGMSMKILGRVNRLVALTPLVPLATSYCVLVDGLVPFLEEGMDSW